MRGFVLAAGFGTRLKPLTDHIPKALIPFAGYPLLKRSLDLLRTTNISNIAVNAHYMAEKIFEYRDEINDTFEIFHEKKIRGTGGAFDYAREFLLGDDSFVVINADIISNVNLTQMAEEFLESDSICTLVAAPKIGDGTILRNISTKEYCGILKKGETFDDIESVDFVGMAFYRKEFLELIDEETFSIVPIWEKAQVAGAKVTVQVDNFYWQDTGTPKQYAKAHFDLMLGEINLLIPPNMKLISSIPAVIPICLEGKNRDKIGPFSWVSDINIDECEFMENVILQSNSNPSGKISNTIITRWGEISFE